MVELVDKMKLTGYLQDPTFYRAGLYLKLGYGNGHIVIAEAKFLTRPKLLSMDFHDRSWLWEKAKQLAVAPRGESQWRGFIRGDAKPDIDATKLATRFEAAYDFDDITHHIQSLEALDLFLNAPPSNNS